MSRVAIVFEIDEIASEIGRFWYCIKFVLQLSLDSAVATLAGSSYVEVIML
jgi:hypothetical protein